MTGCAPLRAATIATLALRRAGRAGFGALRAARRRPRSRPEGEPTTPAGPLTVPQAVGYGSRITADDPRHHKGGSMNRLTERHGFATVEDAVRFSLIRLGGQPETEVLRAPLSAIRTRLRDTHDALEEAVEQRMVLTAILTYLDGSIDREVMRIVRDVLVMTDNRRDDPRFVKLFPAPASTLLRGVATPEQNRFVESLCATIEQDDTFAALRPRATRLREGQAKLMAALADREAKYAAEARATVAERLVVDEARRAVNALYPQLSLLFPDDPTLVESFFRPLTRTHARAEAETTPET